MTFTHSVLRSFRNNFGAVSFVHCVVDGAIFAIRATRLKHSARLARLLSLRSVNGRRRVVPRDGPRPRSATSGIALHTLSLAPDLQNLRALHNGARSHGASDFGKNFRREQRSPFARPKTARWGTHATALRCFNNSNQLTDARARCDFESLVVASAADAASGANRCAPLRCLATAAITHLYDRRAAPPARPSRPAAPQGAT
ncbi:unnamed protein product, partial [Iphiclides podalirius]